MSGQRSIESFLEIGRVGCEVAMMIIRESAMDSLFSKYNRVDTDPARSAEPDYSYLDRSARPEFNSVRREIDRWFQAYPKKNRIRFRGGRRLRTEWFGLMCVARANVRQSLHPWTVAGQCRIHLPQTRMLTVDRALISC